MEANKVKALEAALSQIDRQFGKGTVMRMGDQPRVVMPSISTGSLGLDIALGIGGLPKGRICEIYGPESSGKTTFCLSIIAQAQKQGGNAVFIDVEHALDPRFPRWRQMAQKLRRRRRRDQRDQGRVVLANLAAQLLEMLDRMRVEGRSNRQRRKASSQSLPSQPSCRMRGFRKCRYPKRELGIYR